ncbi:MAG: IclR family transcriptional regulator [Xanthobacteraceae bacterium]|nr:IclR family transcriptional regulator [Xanthobacteraceae bacterium]
MPYSSNQSLAKAFAILEVLNLTRGGMTASEVAARTGLPTSSAHRFLQNLCKLGYVAWEPEHKLYTIGFALTLFGNRRLIIERIVKRARPFLRELGSQTGLAVYLGSLEGSHAVIEHRVVPARATKGAHELGTRLDAHAHSLGKALLALTPRPELLRIYNVLRLPAHTAHTLTHRDRLLREMADVLAKGYAVDNEELNPGVRSISCALLNPKGRAICAIAIEGPRPKLDAEREALLLRALFAARTKIMEPVK